MNKLLQHMGPVFKQWADEYYNSEITNQFEDFQKKNPEESAKCELESFKEKLLAYHIFNGHYINTKYFTQDINSVIQKTVTPERNNVVLSKKLLKFIDEMQDEDFGLDCYQSAISEAVCFIGTVLYTLKRKEKKEAFRHIEALSITRERMEALRKQ